MEDGNTGNDGGDSEMLTMLVVPVHFRESDADAICEVAGLASTVPSKVVGDITAGLAGLASAGEDQADLQSLLAMETALVSITVSLGKLGVEEGTVVGGTAEGMLVKLPSSSSIAQGSSIDASSESVAGIMYGCCRPTSLDT